jgi:hypothetical protein
VNAVRILVGSGFGTAAVWIVATADPYLALGVGVVGAGAAVGVQRSLGSPGVHPDDPNVEVDDPNVEVDDPNVENAVETDGGGDDADGEIGLGNVDFDGSVAALVTLLIVLAGSFLAGTAAGRAGAIVVDALVVLGVFGYTLFGLLVPGIGLAGLGGAAVSCRVSCRMVARVGG